MIKFFSITNPESRLRMISFIFVMIILFLLYFSTNNISTWVFKHGDGDIPINFLNALFSSIVFAIYTIFIVEYIRPAKFNLKITILVVIGLIIFLIFTFFLVD